MIILGIESSCDDTSVALVKADESGFEILAEKTASQIEVHKKYGGVVPEIAGRCHAENIGPLIQEVHESARITKPDVIAVTSGPGLITGLMVGVEAAKTLSYLWNTPIVSINHLEGHIHSVEITNSKLQIPNKYQISNIKYPALALIASGGHTE
ncbi:MAG: tRNA (adenosine(37)-N6)-threonylcarbamoyltransferase complex transferase subunit TsaD, partial [Patescibacteria group bacterium]